MTGNDRMAFATLLYGLGETFNETVSDSRAEIYFRALSDLSLEDVKRAAAAHVRTSKFFPKPAELREVLEGNAEDRAEIAWAHVVREVKRVGWIGTPTWPDEATKRAAMDLFGGWRALCENLPAGGPELLGVAKNFKASFGAYTRRDAVAALPPSREVARNTLGDLRQALLERGLPTGKLTPGTWSYYGAYESEGRAVKADHPKPSSPRWRSRRLSRPTAERRNYLPQWEPTVTETMTADSELVPFRGGLLVPAAAVLLLLEMERRGIDVRVDPTDGSVVCRPGRLLSDADKRAIQRHREDLKRLVFYCEVVQ